MDPFGPTYVLPLLHLVVHLISLEVSISLIVKFPKILKSFNISFELSTFRNKCLLLAEKQEYSAQQG